MEIQAEVSLLIVEGGPEPLILAGMKVKESVCVCVRWKESKILLKEAFIELYFESCLRCYSTLGKMQRVGNPSSK